MTTLMNERSARARGQQQPPGAGTIEEAVSLWAARPELLHPGAA